MATPNASSELEQALTVFNHAAAEIRFFKGQQWLVTNYALIAYGALAATPQVIEDTCLKAVASALCAALVVLSAVAAGWVLYSLSEALKKERTRMDKARCKLPVIKALHANGGWTAVSSGSWGERWSLARCSRSGSISRTPHRSSLALPLGRK